MSGAMNYVMPALMTAGGLATGNPMMAGAGLAGGLGTAFGGGAGSVGNPMGAVSSFLPASMAMGGGGNPSFTPWANLNPAQQGTVNSALEANPALSGLQGMVSGVDPMGTAGGNVSAGDSSLMPNLGSVGDIYMRYLVARRLQQMGRTAPAFGSPSSQQPPLNLFSPTPAAVTPPQLSM